MMKILLSFVPALIIFGPLFIAISARRPVVSAADSLGWLGYAGGWIGYAGALGLAVGLGVMFGTLLRQGQEIRQLRQRLDKRHQGIDEARSSTDRLG